MSSNPNVPRVLFIVGAVGVGKSDASYRVFARLWSNGIQTARLDLDELGMCHPAPPDDPDNHRLKSAVLAAAWPEFRSRATRCLVLAGGVNTRAEADLYRVQIPEADWIVCRLRVGDEERRKRIVHRAEALGSREAETAFWIAVGQEEDAALDAESFVDLVLDIEGRDREEVVDLILESTRWSAAGDSVPAG